MACTHTLKHTHVQVGTLVRNELMSTDEEGFALQSTGERQLSSVALILQRTCFQADLVLGERSLLIVTAISMLYTQRLAGSWRATLCGCPQWWAS